MTEQDDIESVRRALDAGFASSDIENVVPIIAPRSYFEFGNWPGPFADLRSSALGITWSVLRPDQTMVYVNHDRALLWERESVDWRQRAMDNLQRNSDQLWTHEKRDASGRLLWAGMMHDDGLGSSRLLLRERILTTIGGDYRVGLPDRSCALVVPLTAGRVNLEEAREMARRMFAGATTPMLGELFEPEELVD